MKKTYITLKAEVLDMRYFDFMADGSGLVETSTGGADYGLSNKKEQEDETTSNMIWNNWE